MMTGKPEIGRLSISQHFLSDCSDATQAAYHRVATPNPIRPSSDPRDPHTLTLRPKKTRKVSDKRGRQAMRDQRSHGMNEKTKRT